MKHKHAEIIAAYIDGIQCEYWFSADRWVQINEIAVFDWADDVRIKPESQQEQEPHIKNYEKVLKAYRELVEEQDKKIIDLAMKLTYANQTIENLTVDEPPKEQKPQYLYVYRDRSNNISVYHTMMAESYNNWFYMGKVRVEK